MRYLMREVEASEHHKHLHIEDMDGPEIVNLLYISSLTGSWSEGIHELVRLANVGAAVEDARRLKIEMSNRKSDQGGK